MADLVEIKVGETVVDYDRQWGNVKTRVVTGVKPKTYTYLQRWKSDPTDEGEERRRDRSFVVFSGPAHVAALLAERLVSSEKQKDHAQRLAADHMRARNEKFIAKAIEAKAATP